MFCEASDRLIGKASDPRYEGGDSNVMKKIKRNEKKYQYGTIAFTYSYRESNPVLLYSRKSRTDRSSTELKTTALRERHIVYLT